MNQAERMCDRIVLLNRGRKLVEGTVSEVRARFSTRIVVLDGSGDMQSLARAPGVVDAQITAGHARLELADNGDPEAVLRYAMNVIRVARFEIVSPDLQEIFMRLVENDQRATAPASGSPAPEVVHG
jgi:ABC-2 type transport system ATP-binding protein